MSSATLVSLAALAALFYLPSLWQAWIGAALLAMALAGEIQERVGGRLRQRIARKRAKALDWKVIDASLSQPRPMRDCERQETLGVCTGRDCLVYDDCTYNIKRVGL